MKQRHVVQGDLNWLEFAIADHVAKYGEHLTGRPYDGNIAGIPCAVANMAMSVIRKNIVGQWTEPDQDHTRCPRCGLWGPTVDVATLDEREPRHIPACACDQEPYQ